MAIPTKLEFKQRIEEIRAQIRAASENPGRTQRDAIRGKRARNSNPSPTSLLDLSAFDAVLDALVAVDTELSHRGQSLEHLEAEFP